MILDGCHFQYGSFDSRKYGLIFAHCDTEAYTQLMGEVSSSYLFNRRNKTRYIISDDFTDSPISFEAEIITEDVTVLTPQQRREIERVIFNQHRFAKLFVDMQDDCNKESYEQVNGYTKRLYFNCRFVNPSKIETISGVVGYSFTIECDSHLAWQEPLEKAYRLSNGASNIVITTDTDINGYTYPDVIISIGSSGGDITITNTTDDNLRITKFTDLPPSSKITMKGNLNYISGNHYERFSNQNFIRLVNGTNTFSLTGDINAIEFKWQNRRFL